MSETLNPEKQTISLVLGSGGARGLAHIGVIQVLEEQGYTISSISGSSMGALVGGIYAAGKLDIYTEWVCALDRFDVFRLLDVSFSGSAIFKGEKIINTLRELIGEQMIEDLPISFTAIATDLEESKEIWLSSGHLCEAIRASIAFPTVFSAVPYKGKTLVDGGLLNPIPIAPTLRDLTDMTIAVSLSGNAKVIPEDLPVEDKAPELRNKYHQKVIDFIESMQRKDPPKEDEEEDAGFFDIISKSIDVMQLSISNFKLASYQPDILIEIPKDVCNIYEFERAKELIEVGRQIATAKLKEYNHSLGKQ